MKAFIKWLIIAVTVAITVTVIRKHSVSSYSITDIYRFEEAQGALNVDAKTLVFFDIDDTILTSSDASARTKNWNWLFIIRLALNFPGLIKKSSWERVHSTIWTQTPRILIEPSVKDFIADLQNKGAVVLGFTAMETGTYGIINHFPEWRYQEVCNLGIQFSDHFKNKIFTNLPSFHGGYPELYKGILFANRDSKGAVLEAFLDSLDYVPSQIVYFDDGTNSLVNVGEICYKRGIPHQLYDYLGQDLLNGTFDTARALRQFEEVITTGHWTNHNDLTAKGSAPSVVK